MGGRKGRESERGEEKGAGGVKEKKAKGKTMQKVDARK
jgi:hypothetical protein